MAGWWWNSNTDPTPSTTQPTAAAAPPPASSPGRAGAPPDPTPQARRSGAGRLDQQNRDEERALSELRAAFYPSPSTSARSSQPSTTTESSSSSSGAEETTTGPGYDAELYGTTLRCSACFDAAYYCSSVGGQLTNIYRYGALRSCTELWAQWRFCMRTKTMGEEERARSVWEWNREKEARKRLGRSSEEVWGARARRREAEAAEADGGGGAGA